MRRSTMILAMLLMLVATSVAIAATARNVNPQEASALLVQRPDVYLLDVRTPEEYGQFHLANAHLIPIDQITRRLGELPKDRPIVVYCAVGSRSAQVFNYLARGGYPEVYNLDGGIYAWMQRGFPVLKGKP